MDQPARFFGSHTFETLSDCARKAARCRVNLNFHPSDSHPAHRFLNAVEPESYIRPHRHADPLKDETFVALRGAFGIVLFDDAGRVMEKRVIRAGGELVGAHIPAGIFHALVALERSSVFFEVKAGPYDAKTDKEWGAWAPEEDDARAATYVAELRALFEPDVRL